MQASYRYRGLCLSLFLVILPLTGCLFRNRKPVATISTSPLKSATRTELVDYINSQAQKMQSMQATVDIDTTVGGQKRGKITDYQQIRGYVLARKPSMLRMIGLMPIVRNRAFDMVSDGKQFKLWIPPKNRFVEGRNDVDTPNAKQPLENLRPQHIYDALMLREIDPSLETVQMAVGEEIVTDAKGRMGTQPDYEVYIFRKKADGDSYLSRKIVFSRVDLLPNRQIVYDENGNQATDSLYGEYQNYDGVDFPSKIEIKRPQEEYDITLSVLKLQLNEPLGNDKFLLDQPQGADVIHLNEVRTQAQGPDRASK